LAVWNEKISPFVLFFGGGAVCLLFCISGLLILQSLIKHNDWHVFAVNRIKRIYPLFIVLHIFSFTWGPIRGKAAWMASVGPKPLDWLYQFFTNLFLLPGVFPLTLVQQLAWSLSYEAAFYVVSCFIFVGVKKVTAKQNLGYPMVALGGAAAIALLVFHPFFWFFLVGITTYFLLEKGLANKVPGGHLVWLSYWPTSGYIVSR
jgi:peptidoglycan/LPS O-acetylase OafA/YrhL